MNTHLYIPDPLVVGPLGDLVCATCGLPEQNRAHKVKDTSAEMEESRRRVGER